MGYTRFGNPWADGSPPGLDATFFTGVEDWILSVDQPTPVVVNGSTSGIATLYQPIGGTTKLIIVALSNFRNGGGSAQTLAIPAPISALAVIITSDVNTFTLKSGGSSVSVNVLTGLGGSGGTVTNVASMGSNSVGFCGTFDTISFNSGAASAHSGLIVIQGV